MRRKRTSNITNNITFTPAAPDGGFKAAIEDAIAAIKASPPPPPTYEEAVERYRIVRRGQEFAVQVHRESYGQLVWEFILHDGDIPDLETARRVRDDAVERYILAHTPWEVVE